MLILDCSPLLQDNLLDEATGIKKAGQTLSETLDSKQVCPNI